MPAVINHSWCMTQRQLRALLRQPAWIVITLVQPLMWLLLFGSLFKSIVNLPGFGASNHADWGPRSRRCRSASRSWRARRRP
jgi:ABC-2 type transport system permease protein